MPYGKVIPFINGAVGASYVALINQLTHEEITKAEFQVRLRTMPGERQTELCFREDKDANI